MRRVQNRFSYLVTIGQRFDGQVSIDHTSLPFI